MTVLGSILVAAISCSKTPHTPAPTSPTGVSDVDADARETGEDAETATQAPPDRFRVATFNLQWAHDHRRNGTTQAKKAKAKDEDAWNWKAEAIGKVLAQHAPEVVALQELGGEDELYDILAAIKQSGGPEYDYALVPSDDPFTGHQIAVISTYRMIDARRLDIHLRRHVVVDVELPEDQTITLIAIHAPEGERQSDARNKQVKALKRAVDSMRAANPVIVLGTLGSGALHTDGNYSGSAAGMLAGKHTRDEDDDCHDSVAVGALISTTRSAGVADRIYACGLEMVDAEAHEEGIIRGAPDDENKPWSDIPVDEGSQRDVSDHLLVIAEIKLPSPAPEGDDEAAEITASR